VIPRSRRRERIEENFAIFDFELTPEELRRLDRLGAWPRSQRACASTSRSGRHQRPDRELELRPRRRARQPHQM